jgi:hypothetical protein
VLASPRPETKIPQAASRAYGRCPAVLEPNASTVKSVLPDNCVIARLFVFDI